MGFNAVSDMCMFIDRADTGATTEQARQETIQMAWDKYVSHAPKYYLQELQKRNRHDIFERFAAVCDINQFKL